MMMFLAKQAAMGKMTNEEQLNEGIMIIDNDSNPEEVDIV